ncbi:DNA methyltransferase [Dysosmobacter sp. Sow4_B12]|uniref:DNA methyltransferase n=1 Tax=Dysosmobacter sp. Sow4_B12 TaxID=3438777 RepID=UPI003F9254B8
MTDAERRAAAKQFAADWKDRGDEKQETQTFWLSLLQKVYGVAEPDKFISFEKTVTVDDTKTGKSTTKFIDGYIGATRVLVEQKGAKIDLNKGETQSDGSILSPYQQARRYGGYLPANQQPRWIVVCNFKEFRIHDMNRPNDTPGVLLLADLEKEYSRLNFLVDTGDENIRKEMEISLQAGELVGVLYDALLKQYAEPESEETLKSLNALCVRLVFCLYAEDAGIFGKRGMFHDYLRAHRAEDRRALINLFRVLDQKPEKRDRYLDEDLAAFPYVNGGLFADENIEIPRLGDEIIDLLLTKASEDFDWSAISPTIFGAVFESTLNPETRRSGGMHYTSIENIHKVIDPLFLDDLKAEFEEIKSVTVTKTREAKLRAFQNKLASLKFLDPACGSGNFLTETYLSLRRLENKVISELHQGQIVFDLGNPIQVSISQFYGIEINDFAVTVAKTALWIAESQMMKETEDVVHMSLDFLPLKTNACIVEGNALRMDWESVVPKAELNYIMGNPPFVGASRMTKTQKDEAVAVFGKGKRVNSIDYVGAWYHKAAALMHGTAVRAAFVSTNSITQGEQVAPLWEKLLSEYNVHIDFAYRTFKWDSEAKEKAAVHCVIIGFSTAPTMRPKLIFTGGSVPQIAQNINPYLVDAPNVVVTSRGTTLCDVPRMTKGNQPSDGGNLILSQEELDALIAKDGSIAACVRRYVGSKDFINNDEVRYCLWLKGVSPALYRKNAEVMRRLEAVREMRLASSAAPTRALAEKPYLFFSTPQTDSNYLCIPEVSSERRRYIPIGFMDKSVIASNKLLIVPDATLYHFGILTSNVHMGWVRAVAGRLEMRYQYSGATVYNNFPWPMPTDEQRAKIEQTAQAILDARALYPDCSLADLYDEVTMPPELRKAHQANDKAVMQAYGFWGKLNTETACVAELMKMYQKLTEV